MKPNSKPDEPKSLRRGKEFHRKIQKEWIHTAEGEVTAEKSVVKQDGRRGRIDIFVDADKTLAAIAEIKASDWDKMTLKAVRRNVRRQARQIWHYVESQLSLGQDISPGVVFPKRPQDSQRMNLIEKLFEEEGISVVWEDESIRERKARG